MSEIIQPEIQPDFASKPADEYQFPQWVEKTRRLTELKPFERNPRNITESQRDKLRMSLVQDGYHSRIKCTIDGRVIGGHQRLSILKELGFTEIQVLQPDREIDDETFKRICLRDNHNNGTFDLDMLANDYELEWLRNIGLHEVMNVPPEDDGAEPAPGRKLVCCPGCGKIFPTKGNGVKNDE